MLLAQGRFWEIRLARDEVSIALLREAQSEALPELEVSVPLDRWNRLVKHTLSDRKLIGGILLDFAKHKEYVATAVAQDRLFSELQRVVLDATASLVENGRLALVAVDVGMD
ncbi:MAG: hypothetical protein VX681_17640 [Myxococcota bacterium]|nr:hypothetical protein [Myxococcota bacterium]